MARRRSASARTSTTTPAPTTVLNIGLVESPQPLTSTAVTPRRRALYDTPSPGTQPVDLPRDQRSRTKTRKIGQYAEDREKTNERVTKNENKKAREARKNKNKNSTASRSKPQINSERLDANAVPSSTEAGDRAASKTPTPIPHSLAPEGQEEHTDSFDYENATKEDLVRALMDSLRENCDNRETQDVRESLQQIRRDQAAALDAADGYSEIEVLSQAPLGASGGFILNHRADEDDSRADAMDLVDGELTLNFAPVRASPFSLAPIAGPRPVQLPFLGYPSVDSPANLRRSYTEIDDNSGDRTSPGYDSTMYGIPTSSQSLGNPIPRPTTSVNPRPAPRADLVEPLDCAGSVDPPRQPGEDGEAADYAHEGGAEDMGGAMETDGEGREDEGTGIGLGLHHEPMEEDGELLDDQPLEEDGELLGDEPLEDGGAGVVPLPTSAQLPSRRLPSPESEPEPEVLQLRRPAARTEPTPHHAPALPTPANRRVVQEAGAYLTPLAHRQARPPTGATALASLRRSQAPLALARRLPTAGRQAAPPARPLSGPDHQLSTSARQASAPSSQQQTSRAPPRFAPPPAVSTAPRLPVAPELLQDDEEARAAAVARANGKPPARQSKKSTMAHLFGFQHQVAALAKALLFMEALLRGAWQTRGTLEGWLTREVWADAWEQEVGEHIPVEAPIFDAIQVILDSMAGNRGKCKERARPIMPSRTGLIRYVKTEEDLQHNLAIIKLLSGDRFHFSDPENNRGPFQSIMLYDAIAEIAFNGPGSVGALFPDRFQDMPDPLIGFACCMLEHSRNEWQTGRFVPHDLSANVMLGRYIHHMERLEIAELEAPGLMRRLREGWYAHGIANTRTTPVIQRAPDRSLEAFAELFREDARATTNLAYARRPTSISRPRSIARNTQPSASSSRPRPPVIDNRPPPEPMEFDDEEEAPPPRAPSPADPFADERDSDGRYTSRAKGKGRR